METFLRIAVITAFFFCVIALLATVTQTLFFGKKPIYATPRGNSRKGVAYAFGRGMMPWEKESARKHLPTYFSGFIYHFGIFAGLFYLFSLVIPFQLGFSFILLLKILTAAGLACGLGLLIKRTINEYMRKISCPDDFFANGLVDIFLFLSLMDMLSTDFRSAFYVAAAALLLYIPVGKVRHCFFFFYCRILFGRFFGRRGVYPSSQSQFKGDK